MSKRFRVLAAVAVAAASLAVVSTAQAATVITDYDVSIIKQAQPATVLPGQDITYTMTVTH
ncbi:MAG: hypothetical protein OEO77_14520, partial [Acidimicrobiia bacterium]|nr:hypothetical protein [Acidimicrobiia bacterium]